MSTSQASGPDPTRSGWWASLDDLPQGAFLLDAEGGLVDANAACLDLYGLSRPDFLGGGPIGALGNPVREDGSPWPLEEHPGSLALRTGHRSGGQVVGLWNPQSRQRIWLEVHAIPEFRPGETRPHRALVTLQDLTLQRQTAAQLKQSEAQFRRLFDCMTDHVPDQILQVDSLGRVQYLNHALPGQRSQDLVGHDWLEGLPEAFQAPARAAFERVMQTRKGTEYEVQGASPTGEPRWYHCRLSPLVEGARLVGLMQFSMDITRQKEAETALRNIALRDEAILANMQEGLLLFAPDGRILLANTAAEAVWRRGGLPLPGTQQEIVQSLEWVRSGDQLLPPGECPSSRLLRGLRFTNLEAVLKFKGLAWAYEATYSGVPVLDASGELLYAILTFRDTAEQNRLEADRRDLERQFQRTLRLESLGSLAGGVARDLNNVLGAVMALSSLQEEQAQPGSPLHRDMGSILKACRRGRSLVQGLLGFAHDDSSPTRSVNLNALVREQVDLLEKTPMDRVVLKLDLEGDLRSVQGDPLALGQALWNLCLNAVEAMPQGGTLRLSTRQETAERVLLEIRDTGTGMAVEVLARCLDPLFTTRSRGLGLGLPMAYGAIKAHQGTLDIQSQPGLGTTVSIRLPIPSPEGPRQRPSDLDRASQPRLGILVVDDEDYVRESLTELVAALGYQPLPAPSGEEALRILLEEVPVHLVILDLQMPGLGGAATLERLRRLRPELPVVVVTGRADQKAQELCRRYLRVSLLSKPFTLAQIKAHLAQVGGPRA